MQMGVARKIKNGARRIALDRAEEARVAAFAAYEALGVKVPIGLATTIVPATDDEAAEASAYTSTNLVEGPNINDVVRFTEVPLRVQQSEPTGSFAANQRTSNEPGSKESESAQNQGSPKNDVSKEPNILQQDMGSGPLSGCPQPEPLKSEVAISDKGFLFTGSLVLEEKVAVDIVVADVVEEPTRGPVDVDNLPGGFEAFLTQWQSVDEFAFDLYHRSQSNGTLPEIFEIVGIAVCWKNSPVYYVNFLALDKFPSEGPCDPMHVNLITPSGETPTSVTDDTWNATQTRWRKVGDMLSKSGARKIGWDIKSQLHALKSPGLFVPSLKQAGKVNGVSDLKARELQLSPLPPLKVVEPVVDIRVAAWLLWPDEESSQTISLEQVSITVPVIVHACCRVFTRMLLFFKNVYHWSIFLMAIWLNPQVHIIEKNSEINLLK
jgi:DNA polymerase theta